MKRYMWLSQRIHVLKYVWEIFFLRIPTIKLLLYQMSGKIVWSIPKKLTELEFKTINLNNSYRI